MTNNDPPAASSPARRRRIIAAALCPLLGTTPFVALSVYDQHALTALDAHGLWTYLGGTYFAYMAAAMVMPIFWLLMIWTKAPNRAWAVVPLLAAIFSLMFSAIAQTLAPATFAFFLAVFGLPIAVAYALLVGASWRIGARRPA